MFGPQGVLIHDMWMKYNITTMFH